MAAREHWLGKALVEALAFALVAGLAAAIIGPWAAQRFAERFHESDCDDPTGLVRITPTEATATSSHADQPVKDGRGTLHYQPAQGVDGDTGTAWVEGVPAFGIGQTITFGFAQAKQFALLCVVDGYALSWDLYQTNARIRGLDLIGGGQQQNATLIDAGTPDRPAIFQTVRVRLPKTSNLELKITSVYASSDRQRSTDTALSEIEFWAD